MAKFDLISDINLTRGALQTLSGTTPNNSALIDMRGYEALAVYMLTGTVTDAGAADGFTMKLQHSDTTAAASFTDCAAADLIPNSAGGTTIQVTSDTDDDLIKQGIGYRGGKAWVRAVYTGTSGTNAIVSTLFVRARGSQVTSPVPTIGSTTAAT